MSTNLYFERLEGHWEGSCRTWFEPGKLADESTIIGHFSALLDGRFLRHQYSGSMLGEERHGDETLAFNSVSKLFQSAWMDSFHMNYAILFSEGKATQTGFEVRGDYDVEEGTPKWGWRTVFELVDDDHLTITAFNVSPQGEEAKAVETKYARIHNA